MSSRKKQSASGTKKQPPISSYFSSKSKPNAVLRSSKRLVQSSLATRPLRSRKPPENNDVLDLTRSTSPAAGESESPPSTKKRKTEGGPLDRSPQQSARHDLFDNDISPLSSASSPAPSSHLSPPTKLDEMVDAMTMSPSPLRVRHADSMVIDDPNEIVESSQTQYIHLHFTPPSHRTRIMETQRIPPPVFTPTSHRSAAQNHETNSAARAALESSANPTQDSLDWRIPSSQGEVSEPRTPRKRSWAMIDRSRTPSKAPMPGASRSSSTVVASSSIASSSQESQMPPPMLPASAMRGSVEVELKQGASNEVAPSIQPTPEIGLSVQAQSQSALRGSLLSSRLASLRSRPPHPPYSDDRADHVPSSQGEPSLAPTELGTMESPQKPPGYPSVDTDLLTVIPSSVSGSQEAAAAANTSSRQPSPLPLPVPRPNFAQPLQPRTPSHVVHRDLTSSPTNLPSPRALLSSMGQGSVNSTQRSVAPPRLVSAKLSTPKAIEKRTLDPKLALSPSHAETPVTGKHPQGGHASANADQPQSSPERNQSSSQTIIPSSQPMHDSSPSPEYDMGPEVHSFTQAQIQRQSQKYWPSATSGSQSSSGSPDKGKSRARYSPPQSSQAESSQLLPPSQSPIKGSRVNPDRSAAGMNGVFGMLGFGSEADTHDNSSRETNQGVLAQSANTFIPHTPISHDLPPSSPPPETPPHHAARVAQRELQLGTPGSKNTYKGSPLLLAFERARDRAKTTTPTKVRIRPTASHAAPSSPVPALTLDSQTQNEGVVEDSQPGPQRRVASTSRSKTQTRSQSVGVRSGAGSTRPKRAVRALRPTVPTQRTPLSARRGDMDMDIVGSSDAEEEAMEMQARSPLLDVATSPARGSTGRAVITNPHTPSKVRGYIEVRGKENAYMLGTPTREERLPSSVSPSPIRTRHSSPSPLAEDTQTQEESETPWESLRPSQSVSQVLERRIVEEALAEAERGRVLRAEQEAQREKERAEAQMREQEERAKEAEIDRAEGAEDETQTRIKGEDLQDETLAVTRPRPPSPALRVAVPPTISTPKSRRVLGKETYIVTPTKVVKRTPVKIHRDRAATMTPSSPLQEDEGETEEYTYVDETFNPTESQRSFLNRIVNASSELE